MATTTTEHDRLADVATGRDGETAMHMALFCLAILIVGGVIDYFTPSNILVAVVYGVPIVLAAWVRDLRYLWAITVLAIAMCAISYNVGVPPLEEGGAVELLIAQLNRVMASMQFLLIAIVVHFFITSRAAAESGRRDIERQARELELANDALNQRDEEMTRQNEELQAQAEELERQSEELRITNEELANRERMLEQLLELSRSLTLDLSRDEILKRICASLAAMCDDLPVAILGRQGNEMVVLCHHGMGPDGPKLERLPFEKTFSSLILSVGQSGFLEDLDLRPDLETLQPTSGEPFRAVLATPIRMDGSTIGTISVYSTRPKSWDDGLIGLLESIASQASVSLSNAFHVEEIERQRRRFESVYRTVPIGLFVSEDPNGSHVSANPAGAAMLAMPIGENLSPESPVGARLQRLFRRDDRQLDTSELPLNRAMTGEEIQGEELAIVFPNGRQLTVLVSGAPLHDGMGKIVGAVIALSDITTQKQLQRELETRRREAEENSVRKTRFLAAVSHDIRTPVNAINLMAEVIRRYATDPAFAPQIPELADKLRANSVSLVELVTDVLDLARFDSGKVDLQETEFSLGELLMEEIRQLLPLANDKKVDLRFDDLPRPIWVRTDRVKLARVMGNLIGNGIKFTNKGGVRVVARLGESNDRRIIIEVIDTGVGISATDLQHIFDEFAQIHNPERDYQKGSGLGLSISKRLIEVMGGTISATSDVSRGSTFTVSLPSSCLLVRAFTVLESTPIPPAANLFQETLQGLRVLLVEDHATTREGTRRLLSRGGASVTEAADGREALERLAGDQFDVVLLDMMLPDMDGREVLKAIRDSRPPALRGVLVLTGDLTSERIKEVKQLGADDLIGKPIDFAALTTILCGYHSRESGPAVSAHL